jgi:hypothetical protein
MVPAESDSLDTQRLLAHRALVFPAQRLGVPFPAVEDMGLNIRDDAPQLAFLFRNSLGEQPIR